MFDYLTRCFTRIRKLSSLADQVLVSGGNFLTIAICAHALPLSEQGKFTYVFASYMALLLLNVAGIFQGAAVRAPAQDESYKSSLAKLQLLQALFLSLLTSAAWFGAGNLFGWQPTSIETGLLFAFLIMQQMADFDRRSAYIFASTRRAIFSSAILYPGRIVLLMATHPDTLDKVLVVLTLSALIPAMLTAYVSAHSKIAKMAWIKSTKEHLTYSRLFIAGAPLGWLWAYIPIFLLGLLHGKEQAALLASIRGISNMANVLMEQIETKVVADWARTYHGSSVLALEAATSRLLIIGMSFWATGLVATMLLGQGIVILILGDLYASHWHLLVIGWFGYGVYFLARVYGIKHRTLGSTKVEFVGNTCGVFAAIAVGLGIIPLWGAEGAAWTYVMIAAAMLASQKYFASRMSA